MKGKVLPETSIVIRTFNEERHLPGLLEAIRHQDYQDFEIVVVDSGSFDHTRDIARQYCDNLIRINSEDFTFGYSLNVGVDSAKGRYIAIASAHIKPLDERWLRSLVEPLRDENTAMAYGRQMGWETSKFGDAQDLQRTFGPEPKTQHPPNYFANNANSAVVKALWEKHRFDERLPGLEDIEWARHWMDQGYQVAYEPKAAVYHIHEETWPQVHRRYYREAFAAKSMGINGSHRVPVELIKESGYLVGDIYNAARKGDLQTRLSEIVLFRVNKLAGTTRGLLDGTAMASRGRWQTILFDDVVRSIVIRAPGRAALEESEVPRLRPSDVLVRVHYAGVTPEDIAVFDGNHPDLNEGTARYPIVPGQESSGTVVATGPNVAGISEGDAVVVVPVQGCGMCSQCKVGRQVACAEHVGIGPASGNGGYAEYIAVPSRFVFRLPAAVDPRLAGLSRHLSTVVKGLNRLARAWPTLPERKRCAVVGVGPLGHLCAKLLELRGHDVTVLDRNPKRLSYFAGSNIRVSENRGVLSAADVLTETTGDTEVLEEMMATSMPGAVILLLGVPIARQRVTFRGVVAYDKVIVGSVGADPADVEEALELMPLLELEPFVQHILPLDQFAEAWETIRAGDHLKTLLRAVPE